MPIFDAYEILIRMCLNIIFKIILTALKSHFFFLTHIVLFTDEDYLN